MRKKIGKRIGPVPIALVAVLALAAFISAGFWLVPSNGDVTNAQGLPLKWYAAEHRADRDSRRRDGSYPANNPRRCSMSVRPSVYDLARTSYYVAAR